MQESHVLELQMKINGLEKELAQVRRENAQLKRIPLFIAAVVAVMEGGEVHLRQQGNNQEYISQVNDELSKILKPGTRVAVNNALSIVKIIDEPWMPLFIATVVKAMKNREVYLRRQGDSLEYITKVEEELYQTLKPGKKVAVNNSLSVVKIIEEP